MKKALLGMLVALIVVGTSGAVFANGPTQPPDKFNVQNPPSWWNDWQNPDFRWQQGSTDAEITGGTGGNQEGYLSFTFNNNQDPAKIKDVFLVAEIVTSGDVVVNWPGTLSWVYVAPLSGGGAATMTEVYANGDTYRELTVVGIDPQPDQETFTVQFTGLCPYLEEIYARYAEETGRRLDDVFGATGFLLSPLRLARSECEQVLYFRSRGLRMGIGHMPSLGLSTPVTVAGAAVQKLAESLFLSILRRALWGGRDLSVGGFGVVGEMRNARSMGGRPERSTVEIVVGQVARWYGVRSGAGGGLSDAKEPSPEAGMQKALASVIAVSACGSASLDAGLLSLDEINSPEQMVHDAELTGALQRLLRPVEVTSETLAVEDIATAGPGGNFVGSALTAQRFRQELWQPRVWDWQALPEWLTSGAHSDRRRAKILIQEILSSPEPEPGISGELEHDLRAIIARAVAANAAD